MAAERDCTLGVLAFGDSITNGGGELQWGVALQSWALWLARGLGLPYTGYATDGARARDVVERQIPAFRELSVRPDGRYDVGCLYIGVNDVRAEDFSPSRFEHDFELALGFVAKRCERLLTVLIPHDLARLRAEEPISRVPAIGAWLVTRYDLALAVMRDADRFTVDDPRFSTARVVGPSMLSLDGPAHAANRDPFAGPLRPAAVHQRFT